MAKRKSDVTSVDEECGNGIPVSTISIKSQGPILLRRLTRRTAAWRVAQIELQGLKRSLIFAAETSHGSPTLTADTVPKWYLCPLKLSGRPGGHEERDKRSIDPWEVWDFLACRTQDGVETLQNHGMLSGWPTGKKWLTVCIISRAIHKSWLSVHSARAKRNRLSVATCTSKNDKSMNRAVNGSMDSYSHLQSCRMAMNRKIFPLTNCSTVENHTSYTLGCVLTLVLIWRLTQVRKNPLYA